MSGGTMIGIDVGGTFTDAVMVSDDGKLGVAKAITTSNQSAGAVEAVSRLGSTVASVGTIVHGTTVATNAILERKGADVGLITTDGFRDVLEFQRQERRNIWDLFAEKPACLVPRRRRVGIRERVKADGSIHTRLDSDDARAAIAELKSGGCSAIAVCLLNSYANPEHEQMLEALMADAAPELYAAISSRIAPHFREYDRMSTTVLSAYVGPRIRAYLSKFRQRFAERQFAGSILVMGSNGGVLPPEVASDHAAATCLSGPAGGVLASVQVAADMGIRNAISFDMGGTSTDVSLIEQGRAAMATRSEVAGLPISLPQIRIETVSAGGGSIASLDSGGLLHVGPESAGSQPGPACYGFGGDRPTVADAVFLMGLLRAAKFFGGEMQLDRNAAEKAFSSLASALNRPLADVAEKVYTIANHRMANAVRVVSVREGHDPRDYALIAFGGAGPLHAAAVAEELGISRVVVPMHPGAFSAYGLLCADLRRDFVRSVVAPLSQLADAELARLMSDLVADSLRAARELGSGALRWQFQAEARYRGQAHEVAVSLPARGPTVGRLAARFHQLHQRQFGFSNPHAEVELVNLRAIAVAARQKPRFPHLPTRPQSDGRGAGGQVYAGGRWIGAHYVAREELVPGDRGEGPVVIEETTATCYVPYGWGYAIHPAGHIELARA